MTNGLRSRVVLCAAMVAGPAACVSPSAQISTELTRYGLDADQAICVGDRLEANLSIGQLRQLGRAARAYATDDTSPGRLTVSDLVRVGSRIEDPRIPIEIGQAAAGCGVLAGVVSGL